MSACRIANCCCSIDRSTHQSNFARFRTLRNVPAAYGGGATLPTPIPAAQFWSFMVYDGQTRSMLETDQKLAGLDSNDKNIKKNADGSVTIWFAPKPPATTMVRQDLEAG